MFSIARLFLGLAPSALIAAGAAAPSFSAKDQDGRTVNMAALRGHPVVVYFYPKDRTPG